MPLRPQARYRNVGSVVSSDYRSSQNTSLALSAKASVHLEWKCSSTGIGYHQIGDIAEKEAQKQPPHDDILRFETLGDTQEFCHYIDDRSSGKGQAEDEKLRRMESDAGNRSQERRTTSNETGEKDEFPRNALTS